MLSVLYFIEIAKQRDFLVVIDPLSGDFGKPES